MGATTAGKSCAEAVHWRPPPLSPWFQDHSAPWPVRHPAAPRLARRAVLGRSLPGRQQRVWLLPRQYLHPYRANLLPATAGHGPARMPRRPGLLWPAAVLQSGRGVLRARGSAFLTEAGPSAVATALLTTSGRTFVARSTLWTEAHFCPKGGRFVVASSSAAKRTKCAAARGSAFLTEAGPSAVATALLTTSGRTVCCPQHPVNEAHFCPKGETCCGNDACCKPTEECCYGVGCRPIGACPKTDVCAAKDIELCKEIPGYGRPGPGAPTSRPFGFPAYEA